MQPRRAHLRPCDTRGGLPAQASYVLVASGPEAQAAEAAGAVCAPYKVGVPRCYFTALYWSLTLVMKSPPRPTRPASVS